MAFNHEAYLNAVIEGDYTFELPFVDDIVLIWVGEAAYSGWTRENAAAELGIFGGSTILTINLQAGQHVPIRFLFVNGQAGYFFRVDVRNPNGDIIADGDGSDPAYIITDTCGNFAPNFPPQQEPYSPGELVIV